VRFASAKEDTTDIDKIIVYILLVDNADLTTELRTEIESMYDHRKLIGTTVELVHPPVFIAINSLIATLVVHDRFKQGTVKDGITAFLLDYFKIGNYDFGKELSITELESLVMKNVPGVKSFRITTPSTMTVTVAYNEILTLASSAITYNVSGGIA
jgi:hypothetical protein